MIANIEDDCCCEEDGQIIDIWFDEEKNKFFMICSICDKFIGFCD